ncbi:putative glycolipid-binding domain-containing protein [Nitratireductor mangrovi]|uniref:Glycolipid-binding domain-containing protein n=1 Tax=Nitratireductor mangrovi TaxID=2599600 RepID=A0A5B8KZE4_9HYPH|nr:putative glycolipid-binding domain-containing protein [Nitratireductor mangrovi]QDZ00946.1 putative glycolipid-binding domain-containing protein [Nitratireductor mangrovi]
MDHAIASIFWRRLDRQGHDACALWARPDGFELAGSAVFEEAGRPCALTYRVDCDAGWATRRATVNGFVGTDPVEVAIVRDPTGGWTLNGVPQAAPRDCVDVDLGFTPATNLLVLRRFALDVGKERPAPAAYLAFPDLRLDRLEQHYRRSGEATYDYAAPVYDYAATLTVSPVGFVTDYPQLWSAAEHAP